MNLFDIIFGEPEYTKIPRLMMARLEPHTRLFVAQSFAYGAGLLSKETYQKCFMEYETYRHSKEEIAISNLEPEEQKELCNKMNIEYFDDGLGKPESVQVTKLQPQNVQSTMEQQPVSNNQFQQSQNPQMQMVNNNMNNQHHNLYIPPDTNPIIKNLMMNVPVSEALKAQPVSEENNKPCVIPEGMPKYTQGEGTHYNPYIAALENVFGDNMPEDTRYYDSDGVPLFKKHKPVYGMNFDENGQLIQDPNNPIPQGFDLTNLTKPQTESNFINPMQQQMMMNNNPYSGYYQYLQLENRTNRRTSNDIMKMSIPGFVGCDEHHGTMIDTKIINNYNNYPTQQETTETNSDDNQIIAFYTDNSTSTDIRLDEDMLNQLTQFYIQSLAKRDGVESALNTILSFFDIKNKTSNNTTTKFDLSELVDFDGTRVMSEETKQEQVNGFKELRDAFNSHTIEEPTIEINVKHLVESSEEAETGYSLPKNLGDETVTIPEESIKWHPNMVNGNYIYNRNGFKIADQQQYGIYSNNIYPVYGNSNSYQMNNNPWNANTPYYPNNSYYGWNNVNHSPNIDFQKIADSMTDEELVKLKVQQETNLRMKQMGKDIYQTPPKCERDLIYRTLPGSIKFRRTKFDPTPEEEAEIRGISVEQLEKEKTVEEQHKMMEVNQVINNIPPTANQPPNIPPQFMNPTGMFDINNIGGNVIYYNGVPYTPDRIKSGDPNNPLYGIVTPEHPEGDTNIVSTVGVIPPQADPTNWLDYDIGNPNMNRMPGSNFNRFNGTYQGPYSGGYSYNAYNPTAMRSYEESFMIPSEFDINNNILVKARLLVEGTNEYKEWEENKNKAIKKYIGKSFYSLIDDAKNNPSSRSGIEFIDPDTGETVIKIIKDFYHHKDEGKYVVDQVDYTEEEYQERKRIILEEKETKAKKQTQTRTALKPEDYKKNSPKWMNFINERRRKREEEAMNSDESLDHFMHYNDEITTEDIQNFKHLRIKKLLEERKKLEELYVNPTLAHLKRLEKFCNEYGRYDMARASVLYDMLNTEDTLREDFYAFFEYCIKHLRLLKMREAREDNIIEYKVPYRYRKLPTYTIDEKGNRIWDSFMDEYHENKRYNNRQEIVHEYDSGVEDNSKEDKERFKVFLLKAMDERDYIVKRDREAREKDARERKLFNGRTEEEIIAAYNPYDPNSVYMYNKVKNQKEIDKQYKLYRRIFGSTVTDEQFDLWFFGPKEDEYKEPTIEEQIEQRRRYLHKMTDNNIQFLSTIKPLDYEAIHNDMVRKINENFRRFDQGLLTEAKSLKDIFRALPVLERKLAEERIEKQKLAALDSMKTVSYDRFHNELVRWFNETETGYDLKTSQAIFGAGAPVDPSTRMPSHYIDITKNNPSYEDKLARFMHHCQTSRGNIPLSPLYK